MKYRLLSGVRLPYEILVFGMLCHVVWYKLEEHIASILGISE